MGKKKAPIKKPTIKPKLGCQYTQIVDEITDRMDRFMDIVPPLNSEVAELNKELSQALKELDKAQSERDQAVNEFRDLQKFNRQMIGLELITILGVAAILYHLYK